MFLKKIIKSIPCLYEPALTLVNYLSQKRRARAYKKYGKEALRLFVDCLNSYGYKYTLAFGSILGAVREHGFIQHDLDIDTFMWYEDFNPDLLSHLQEFGFKLFSTFSIDNDKYGREDTFEYKGVHIDVFYLYPAIDKYPYCCDFVPIHIDNKRVPRRIELPIEKNRREVLFEGIPVYIPDNAEQICEFRYGPDYMTPNPNWHWESEYNAIKEWPEMIEEVVVIDGSLKTNY